MASTASDSFPSSPTAPSGAFLADHPLFFSSSSAFIDPAANNPSFPATNALHPAPDQPSTAARKPGRKRPRASRRPPTTVLSTDASNFRAMVQEFTGFPAPPPFAPHLVPGGVLFRAAGSGGARSDSAAAAGAPFQLLRPSPLKLSAAPHALPPICTTTNASAFAQSLFANTNANPPAAAAVTPSSSSEFYGSFGPMLSDAVPRYDDGFGAAADERAGHGHGFFSSFLHAGDRYHRH